jgi:muconolactone delta-isomerase
VLYLVISEVKGMPPAASVASLEQGKQTLEQLAAWQREGKVKAAGVFAGRMGMAFVIDVDSNADLHVAVASLPAFMQAEWQVIPMLSIDEDLAMTEAALEHFRGASG